MRAAPTALAYSALCVGLWAVPLLRVLHAESSALVAGVAFGLAGLSALRAFRHGAAFGSVLGRHLLLLIVPLVLLTATLPFAPNRGYGQGLLLYVTFAPPSVALAVALAYALTGKALRFPYLTFLGVAAALLVFTPLYDLGLHPQFYHYNHAFGGVLGPLYDEELALRPGLFAFRGLTLLWAAALYLLGEGQRGRGQRQRLGAVLGLIALNYALGGWLGFNTPAWRLRQVLPGHVQTAHFDIYFDPEGTGPVERAALAREHEWRYHRLRDTLGVAPQGRVQSYVYPDARTRARLTGAAYTSVAPVWLRRPQMHLLLGHPYRVLGHELVHVFSRSFGLPVVHASRHVGLVEGLAVAFEPPDGLPGADAQVVAAALATGDTLLAQRLAASLGAGGFWTARGAVSYTTTGSFVQFLGRRYGLEKLKKVYAWGDFRQVYGKSVMALADEWEASLYQMDFVERAAAPLARQRFSARSLFEQPSPHWVPTERRLTRHALVWLNRGDTARALGALDRALRRRPDYAPALDLWSRVRLGQGEVTAVLARLDTMGLDDAALLVRRGDARALAGRPVPAATDYLAAQAATPLYAHAQAVALGLRQSLASRPEAIAALYGTARDTSGAGQVLAALRQAPDQPGNAYRQLAAAGTAWVPEIPPGRRNRYLAQRQAWLAEIALRAGWYRRAERHARQASRAFSDLGDRSAAQYLRDVAAQARWAQGAPPVP